MKDDVVHIFIDVKIMLYHGVGVLSVGASFYLHRSALTFLVDDKIPRILMSKGECYGPAVFQKCGGTLEL